MRKKRELVMGACLGPDFISLFDPRNAKVGQTFIRVPLNRPSRLVGVNLPAEVLLHKGRKLSRVPAGWPADRAA
jgi:hypothetical protein